MRCGPDSISQQPTIDKGVQPNIRVQQTRHLGF
jgi:hypothetical protein